MEVKELVEFLTFLREERDIQYTRTEIFQDGSGYVQKRALAGDWEDVFWFSSPAELYRNVKVYRITQKPPDYKSLFSVVDGRLVADFSNVKVTRENCLPLSIAKWVVRGEKMNEQGKIIRSAEEKTCACCVLYIGSGRFGCGSCPIGKTTSTRNCWKTPATDFFEAAERGNLFAALKANEQEVEFLKSLMEKQCSK